MPSLITPEDPVESPVASTSKCMPSTISLQVSYSGETISLEFPATSTLIELQERLLDRFDVPISNQKLLSKGKKIATEDGKVYLTHLTSSSSSTPQKLLLIGPKATTLSSLRQDELERSRRSKAFDYHASQPIPKISKGAGRIMTLSDSSFENDQFKFHRIVPFAKEIPSYEKRVEMLEKLSKDEGVVHLMKEHRFVVGTLTELHPHTQSTILGLNKNAGEEICLRLLTDDLSGTRAYLDVRKVLLHELAHNEFGPHDDKFKSLNSLLNKQLDEYETSQGLKTASGLISRSSAWEPSDQELEEPRRTERRLNEELEEQSGRVRDLEWSSFEEGELRRERVRKAAEDRIRRERDGA